MCVGMFWGEMRLKVSPRCSGALRKIVSAGFCLGCTMRECAQFGMQMNAADNEPNWWWWAMMMCYLNAFKAAPLSTILKQIALRNADSAIKPLRSPSAIRQNTQAVSGSTAWTKLHLHLLFAHNTSERGGLCNIGGHDSALKMLFTMCRRSLLYNPN